MSLSAPTNVPDTAETSQSPPAARLVRFANVDELAAEAARRFVAAIPEGRPFYVALSGGRISRTFYEQIVLQSKSANSHFAGAHFFFADERCVPPTDPESNFLTARQFLFDPLQLRAEQIHRVHAEMNEEFAIKEAEAELCRIAPMDGDGQPMLDIAILGMGEDGHTASLFPGEPSALIESPAVYRAVTAVKPPPRRITLGYAPLQAAKEVWVLASGGAAKTEALRSVLRLTGPENKMLPLGRVLLRRSNSLIFSDIPA